MSRRSVSMGKRISAATPQAYSLDEAAWLAGIIEGEGSVLVYANNGWAHPRIQVKMTDRDIVERVALMLGTNVTEVQPKGGHKLQYSSYLGRKVDIANVLERIAMWFGERRTRQAAAATAAATNSIPWDEWESDWKKRFYG